MHDWERDYGLAEGERFEPDAFEERYDLTQPHILSVLGPIAPGALGMTVFCRGIEDIAPGVEDDLGAILGELETAQHLGLRGLALTGGAPSGNDHAPLRWIAERAPIHVVESDPHNTVWWDERSVDTNGTGFVIVDDLGNAEPESLPMLVQVDVGRIVVGLPRTATEKVTRSLTDLLHSAPLALMNAGFAAIDMRQILVDNPAAIFTRTAGVIGNRRDQR